jgi:hypothetical protein
MESVPEEEFVVTIHGHFRKLVGTGVAGINRHPETSCICLEIAICGLPRSVTLCSKF